MAVERNPLPAVSRALVHILAACGLFLYVWSWFLTALTGPNTADSGAEAFEIALMATFMFFHGMILLLPAAIACVSNLLIFIAFCAYLSPNANRLFRATPVALLVVTPVNVLCGYLVPDGINSRAIGFWVWIASYVVIAVALMLRGFILKSSLPPIRPILPPRSAAPPRGVRPPQPALR